MSASATPTPTNDPTPSKGSPVNEAAELFEDENEQFIRSLESPGEAQKPKAPAASAPKDTLDEILPDVQVAEEASAPIALPTAAKSAPAPIQTPQAAKPEALTKLSEVNVSIKLEAGKVSCSLQKLLSLKENDIIELNQPVGQVLDLRVDGRLIGKGQIVRLGEQLGLRISELADR